MGQDRARHGEARSSPTTTAPRPWLTWNAGPRGPDVDQRRHAGSTSTRRTIRNKRASRSPAAARWWTRGRSRRSSGFSGNATSTVDYQTGLYLFHIDTDTTSRNTYGQDAGAFFATDSQYRTLNTTAGRAVPSGVAARCVLQSPTRSRMSDSAAVFGQALTGRRPIARK